MPPIAAILRRTFSARRNCTKGDGKATKLRPRLVECHDRLVGSSRMSFTALPVPANDRQHSLSPPAKRGHKHRVRPFTQ